MSEVAESLSYSYFKCIVRTCFHRNRHSDLLILLSVDELISHTREETSEWVSLEDSAQSVYSKKNTITL